MTAANISYYYQYHKILAACNIYVAVPFIELFSSPTCFVNSDGMKGTDFDMKNTFCDCGNTSHMCVRMCKYTKIAF